MLIPLISCIVVLPVLFWLARVDTPPRGTWMRILLSLVITWCMADAWQYKASQENFKSQVSGIILFVVLVFLWRPYYSLRIATAFTRFIHSIPQKRGAFRPDFQEARGAAESGDLNRAMKLIGEELEKDPCNFEGLMLQASGYQTLEQPELAMVATKKILDNPASTEEQKRLAEIVYSESVSLQHKLAIHGRIPRKLPN